MHLRRTLIPALVAVALLGAALLPGAASARVHVAVGLGDQHANMFDSPAWQALHLRKTRYFIAWDAAKHPDQLSAADAFVRNARAHHVSVLMHISTNTYAIKKAKLPSRSEYRRYVGRLIKRYRPLGVREWGVFNEANHASEPTYRSPTRAAQYFRDMRHICHGCTIVALDVLDQAGVERYISRWFRALGSSRKYVKNIGIHNYSDTNRKRSTGTRSIIRAVKRYRRSADIWLTETGGVVAFGKSFPCSESRAAARTKYMFSLARKYRRDITRLYAYNWQGTDCSTRFDAGLVRYDGTTRPAYDVFKRSLSGFTR